MQKFAREVPRGNVQLQMSDLAFSEIPHQSRLFLDYLADPLSLKRYYPNAVADPSDLRGFAPKVLGEYSADRGRLCDALARMNKDAGADETVFANIEKLRDDDCVAVLTGQQAGLFTGPLYTIYKALSAARAADDLSKLGVKAVPVFWAATEDHDLDEVRVTYVPDRIEYTPNASEVGKAVGSLLMNASITDAAQALFADIAHTEFTDELRSQVSDAYIEGRGWGSAFLKLMTSLFSDLGLIVVDPMDTKIRALSAPIFERAIASAGTMGDALSTRSREIEKDGYVTQVLIEDDHFPLFWVDDDGLRRALRRDGEGFRAKGTHVSFSREELLDVASQTPERLSPAVMLRPVVQDFLFPTICYFGGGAEVSYFGQNSVVYEVLERPVTPIFHRQSFTVVEAKQRRVMEKFGVDLAHLFGGKESLAMNAAAKIDMDGTGELFDVVETKVASELDLLDRHLTDLDPTVAAALETRRRKIVYHLAALKKKALLAKLRKDETSSRQIADMFEMLLPNGGLQERSLNAIYFLNKYGPKFIEWMYAATDVDNRSHRIVKL